MRQLTCPLGDCTRLWLRAAGLGVYCVYVLLSGKTWACAALWQVSLGVPVSVCSDSIWQGKAERAPCAGAR